MPNWKAYIREMSQHGVTWGDEATLLAASVLFKAEIVVISSASGLVGTRKRPRLHLSVIAPPNASQGSGCAFRPRAPPQHL